MEIGFRLGLGKLEKQFWPKLSLRPNSPHSSRAAQRCPARACSQAQPPRAAQQPHRSPALASAAHRQAREHSRQREQCRGGERTERRSRSGTGEGGRRRHLHPLPRDGHHGTANLRHGISSPPPRQPSTPPPPVSRYPRNVHCRDGASAAVRGLRGYNPPPPDAGTNTPWVEPRCLLSRAPRSPRTHAAYAPSATRRPRPSGHARGRGRREHEHSRRTPRSGLRAILEDPGTQSASSPRPGTYGAHTFS
ncbi:hypothetical protein BDA96_10G271800 [Sorghum bicolor]|uniref:Uncharacterized protein n=1 Tax=Sorghum bicolor TaxID=4558 RepID=A0A921Q714_SORBI|nr:hypothetical protein BDA96_10G271800 [Sorghum bicolor]